MPTIKIFLSHQREDTELAKRIQLHLLGRHELHSYLDVIDPNMKTGEALADHVKAELGECTQLLAIVSEATQKSWWVPWEIGIATEKDYPLATFGSSTHLPEYLRKWPYLQTMAELDAYAEASKESTKHIRGVGLETLGSSAGITGRKAATENFYRLLRRKIGQ